MARKGGRGEKPFCQEDEMVFATEVMGEAEQPGRRGEAVEGDLRMRTGSPKGSMVEDEAIGGVSRGKGK